MIDLELPSPRAARFGLRRWISSSAVAAFALAGVGASARAEGADPRGHTGDPSCPCAATTATSRASEVPQVERWYGWETLAFDGAALAMGITMVATEPSSPVLPVAAATTFYAGAPALHLAHGHADKALGSLGLRAALPAVTAIGGAFMLSAGKTDFEGAIGGATAGMVLGFGVGAVAAAALDATLIARERVPAPPLREARIALSSLTPTVAVLPQGGAVLGVSGLIF